MSARRLALLCGAALLLGACCPSVPKLPVPEPEALPACEVPGPGDVEAAKGAHAAATRFYERDEHQQAALMWLAAYRLDCTAYGLLINLGRAYEKLEQPKQALQAYSAYLERAGSEADPEIVAKVQELQK